MRRLNRFIVLTEAELDDSNETKFSFNRTSTAVNPRAPNAPINLIATVGTVSVWNNPPVNLLLYIGGGLIIVTRGIPISRAGRYNPIGYGRMHLYSNSLFHVLSSTRKTCPDNFERCVGFAPRH